MLLNQSDGIHQMTVQSDTYFCFGFGYVAKHLARDVLKDGATVYGTSRTLPGRLKISALGGRAHGRLFQTGQDIQIPDNCHWLISIPPGENGCPAYNAAAKQSKSAASITYLSTTGVYGDRGGDWVYENSPPSPRSDRARRRLFAENQWKRVRANIVRLPGIYGPGRSAIDRLRSGKARRIVQPGQVFSRAHVDDIAAGLRIIAEGGFRQYVFHLCDDKPAPPQDVIEYAAKLIGMAPPAELPIASADLSDMAKSFYSECKRVSNAATKRTLGWEPKYPSYREGLAAIVRALG